MERIRIMDKVTEAQNEAWEIEHDALTAPRLAKGYHMEHAKDIRRADLMERKKELYAQGDAQNELLDAIAQRSEEIPLFDLMEAAQSGTS